MLSSNLTRRRLDEPGQARAAEILDVFSGGGAFETARVTLREYGLMAKAGRSGVVGVMHQLVQRVVREWWLSEDAGVGGGGGSGGGENGSDGGTHAPDAAMVLLGLSWNLNSLASDV